MLDKENPGRNRHVFIHLAQDVAKRAVANVLGTSFSALDFLVFVNYLVELRTDAEERITQGVFERNAFYSQIVELMHVTQCKSV